MPVTTEKWGDSNLTWLGSAHGLRNARTMTLDPADFTAKVKDGVVPSGTAVAVVSGKLAPYNAAGSGDATKLVGFVLTDQSTTRGPVAAPVLDHGRIRLAGLPDTAFAVPAAANDLTTCVYVKKEA